MRIEADLRDRTLDLMFQRIDRINPTLNAIVWERREEARVARRADAALATGHAVGALHGVSERVRLVEFFK